MEIFCPICNEFKPWMNHRWIFLVGNRSPNHATEKESLLHHLLLMTTWFENKRLRFVRLPSTFHPQFQGHQSVKFRSKHHYEHKQRQTQMKSCICPMGPQIFLYYKNTPPEEQQLKKAFKTVIHHLKGWRIGLKRTRSVQRQQEAAFWKDLSVYWYSQLLPKPPDLGLGVGELHAQVLPALRALHAGGAARGLRRRRVRQETETVPLLWQLNDGLGNQSTGKSPEWHSQSHLWVYHSYQTLEWHKNDGKVLAIEEDKSSTCTSTPKAKSHSSCTGPSGSFKFYFSL